MNPIDEAARELRFPWVSRAPTVTLEAWIRAARSVACELACEPISPNALLELDRRQLVLCDAAQARELLARDRHSVIVLDDEPDRSAEWLALGALDVCAPDADGIRRLSSRARAASMRSERRRTDDPESELQRRFFAAGPVIVFRWRAAPGWPVEYVSPNVVSCFGVDARDFLSGRVAYASVVHPDDLARVAEEVRYHSEAGAQGFDQEYRIVRPSGEERRIFDHTLVTRDAQGRATHFEGYVLDQTDFRNAQLAHEESQRQLLVAQKRESLGLMAGGVAHDFNNILTGITGNVAMAMRGLREHDERHLFLAQALDSAHRAARLAQAMLAYAGRCPIERRTFDLAASVRELEPLLIGMLDKRTRLELSLPHSEVPVDGDPSQLEQVVMNLALNGAEACREREGHVRIALRASHRGVELEVRDNGCGITPERQRSIFDPFFTTKAHGRGLGLSAVSGIVRAHGGEITLTSHVGVGTTFVVTLPRATGPCRPTRRGHDDPSLPSDSKAVLVIDDERSVADVAVRILRAHGHRAEAVYGGFDAVRIFEGPRRDDFDLVLLDRTMPEIDGLATLARLRDLRRELPVILTSGFQESEVAQHLTHDPQTLFLAKPYDVESLGNVVRRIGRASRSTLETNPPEDDQRPPPQSSF